MPFQAVATSEGEAAKKEKRFFAYVECSAKLFENCGEVFNEAVKAAMLNPPPDPIQPKKTGFCSLL